ncbi:hypothetical protein BROUX41_003280 [Berkeleyomyces rouxiae]
MDRSFHRRYGAPSNPPDDNRSASNYGAPLSRAINIPHLPQDSYAPPPLPPPRDPFNGPAAPDSRSTAKHSYLEDSRNHASSLSSIGSSAYGSMENSYHESLPPLRRGGRSSPVTDEGYASLNSVRLPSFSTSFGQLHSRYNLTSTDDYSSSIKDKLGSHIPTRPKVSRSFSRSSYSGDMHQKRPSLNTNLLPPITHSSMPQYASRGGVPDSPPNDPYSSSAVSPNSCINPFGFGNNSDYDRSPPNHHRMSASSRNGHDSPSDENDVPRVNTFDRDRSGTKRRASSPLEVEHSLPPGPPHVETIRRRDMYRGPPSSRLAGVSQVSLGHHMAPMALANAYDRVPPGTIMNGSGPMLAMSGESVPHSTFGTGSSPMNPSPGSSASRGPHQRNNSMASPRRINELKAAGHKGSSYFMCECCSKKPKRFETLEELQAHEAEKQYECQFCHNRFKNKNEAERHQNSLHVRRHSWSCKALDNFNKAFHENQSSDGTHDTCGYCGKDFDRHGPLKADGVTREANDQDWEERVHHLQTAHKFRECNSSKKFFRADHFRQHLKHSHSGTSGKWTNQLENACMRDEEPPLM